MEQRIQVRSKQVIIPLETCQDHVWRDRDLPFPEKKFVILSVLYLLEGRFQLEYPKKKKEKERKKNTHAFPSELAEKNSGKSPEILC